jgi:hypothetical protein
VNQVSLPGNPKDGQREQGGLPTEVTEVYPQRRRLRQDRSILRHSQDRDVRHPKDLQGGLGTEHPVHGTVAAQAHENRVRSKVLCSLHDPRSGYPSLYPDRPTPTLSGHLFDLRLNLLSQGALPGFIELHFRERHHESGIEHRHRLYYPQGFHLAVQLPLQLMSKAESPHGSRRAIRCHQDNAAHGLLLGFDGSWGWRDHPLTRQYVPLRPWGSTPLTSARSVGHRRNASGSWFVGRSSGPGRGPQPSGGRSGAR